MKKVKVKLNITVRPETRKLLDKLAKREHRSVSNLIEVMAIRQWTNGVSRDWPRKGGAR